MSIPFVVAISIVSFIATNLENQLILLAYLHHPQYPVRAISVGYVGATGLILSASYGLSQMTQVMPSSSIHYLGILPICLGGWELLKLILGSKDPCSETEYKTEKVSTSHRAISVGAATMASGGDTLVVFTSLFADTRYSADLVIVSTGIGMALLWIALARWLLGHVWISTQLNRFGHLLLPLFLIGIGVYIWMDTPGDIN